MYCADVDMDVNKSTRTGPLGEWGDRAFRRRVRWGLLAWVGMWPICTGAADSALQPPGRALAEFEVDFWHPEQGVPHQTVTALLQTRDRYLWVGTAAGLARFDGLAFRPLEDDSLPELASARISALLEDREGRLWVGTQGLGIVRMQDDKLTRFGVIDGRAEPDITALAEDAQGHIWIGTQGGLSRWSAGRFHRFESEVLPPGEPVLALHAGRSGTVWVTTRQAVYQVVDDEARLFELNDLPLGRNADFIGIYEDAAEDLWTFGATFLLNLSHGVRINYFPSLDPASSRVWTLCEQDDGTFWIGTSGRGLFQFREDRFERVGVGEGLDQCDVRALHLDDEGNLWIGTSGSGLARLRTRPWDRWDRDQGLDTAGVTALTRDADGLLVVGTVDAGTFLLRGEEFEPLGVAPPLGYVTRVDALCRDGGGGLWIAGGGAGLLRVAHGRQWQFNTADGLGDASVLALAAEPDGIAVWAGTTAGTLHRLASDGCQTWSEADGLTGRPIRCLLDDEAGNLWIGADAGGLIRWDGSRLVEEPMPPGLAEHAVQCLYPDQDGRIWAGTEGAGVYCRTDRGWVRLDTTQGLQSDFIGAIFQDAESRYWFASEQGLFHVAGPVMQRWLAGDSPAVESLRIAPAGTGEPRSTETTGWGGLEFADGRLWHASGSSLISLDPARVRPTIPPRVVIERVLVNGEDIPAASLQDSTRAGRLDPGVQSLDIYFAAVTFSAPERTRFRRRLVGLDPEWSAPDAGRHVRYGPLPPGHYHFDVRAAGADGVWGESGATLAWIVARPFWLSWWFLVLAGTGGIAGIWSSIHFVSLRQLRAQLRRSEERRAMERERSRIARDMHDEIGSKLTRISFLSEVACRDQPTNEEGTSPVRAIADTSREVLQALDEIVWVVNPHNDHLTSLAGYLEEYAHQYFQDTSVSCEVSVDTAVGESPLPAESRHNVFLAFEEALGNVLKHAEASHVDIRMKPVGDGFEILVCDDGLGLGPERGSQGPGHDGLRNMKQRLEAVGGDCILESKPGQGTRVTLRLPTGKESDGKRAR